MTQENTSIVKQVATIGAIGIALSILANKLLKEENILLTEKLINIGAVSTLASIPVGILAINKWPDNPAIVAIILTALGFAVKERMLHKAEPTTEETLIQAPA